MTSLEDFFNRYLIAECDYEERCASTRGRRYADRQTCGRVLEDLATDATAAGFGSVAAYLASNWVITDAAKATECITELATLSCSYLHERTLTTSTACLEGINYPGFQAAGAACSSDADCDRATLYCAYENTCPVCNARADNTFCFYDSECPDFYCNGLFCGTPSPTGPGTSCAVEADCLGWLSCAGSSNAETCRSRGGDGALCGAGYAACRSETACIAGYCAARLEDGVSCARDGSNACWHFCSFTTASAASGTCAALTTLPGAGQPCALHQPYADPYYYCAQGTWPDVVDNTCTCRAPLGNGQTCTASSHCSSGRCNGIASGGTTGTCAAKASSGQLCDYGSECASGHCVYDDVAQDYVCGPDPCP